MKHKRNIKSDGIYLEDTFKIVYKDDLNLQLQELVSVVKTDKETKEEFIIKQWDGKGCYYHSIPSALKAYCRLKQNRCKSLEQLISTMEYLHEKIDNLFTINCDVPES